MKSLGTIPSAEDRNCKVNLLNNETELPSQSLLIKAIRLAKKEPILAYYGALKLTGCSLISTQNDDPARLRVKIRVDVTSKGGEMLLLVGGGAGRFQQQRRRQAPLQMDGIGPQTQSRSGRRWRGKHLSGSC